MNSSREASVRQAAQQIHDYLLHHPEAEDTIAGIIQWWLPEKCLARRATVQDALNELVSQELLLERRGEDGTVYFRLNPAAKAKGGRSSKGKKSNDV